MVKGLGLKDMYSNGHLPDISASATLAHAFLDMDLVNFVRHDLFSHPDCFECHTCSCSLRKASSVFASVPLPKL